MKTKIPVTVLALIISGTMAFAQSKTKSDKEQSTLTKTEMQKSSVYYTCPMHSDVVSDKPGKCTKCGMNLVEKKQPVKSKTKPKGGSCCG